MTILERAQRLTEFMAQPHPKTGEPHSLAEAAAECEDDVPSFLRLLNIWHDRDTRLNDEGRTDP